MSRVRRSREEWREVVAAWRRSGRTIAEFAKLNNLNANTLGRRQREVTRTVRPNGLTLVPVAPPVIEAAVPPLAAARPEAAACLDVALPGGITIRVPQGSDVAWAASLIRQVGGR